MLTFAPTISPRLLEALVELDDRSVPIAEVSRRVGDEADRLGLTRPSYERIRVLVHESRRLRARPSTASILFDLATRARPPDAFLDHVAGVDVAPLRR